MRPLFTVHAGEYLVGDFIERSVRGLDVWVPSRDTGVDLLVTGPGRKRSVALQVKFSRDFLVTHMKDVFQPRLRACGWWKFERDRLVRSSADYWVLVLVGFQHRTTDFVVVPPKELLRRLDAIHGRVRSFQSYVWVTATKRCWEARGLRAHEQLAVAAGAFRHPARDLSAFLNDWSAIQGLKSRRTSSRASVR